MKRLALYLVLTLALMSLSTPAHAQQTNALTNVFYISADGDCTNDPCTSPIKRMCRTSPTSTTVYLCDMSTGFYKVMTGTPGTFDAIGSGTNISSTLTCGSGCTMSATGTGIVRATEMVGSGSTTAAVDLATAEAAGTLTVAKGGTNATSQTANRVLITGIGGGYTTDADLTWDGVANTMTFTGAFPIVLATANATVDGRNLDLVAASTAVVNICPSGCKYTTLKDACATESASTAANPKAFHVLASKYAVANTICSGQDHGTIYGDGIGVSILQGDTTLGFGDVEGNDCVATPSACKGALNLGTSTNMTVYGLSLWGARGLWWNAAGTGGGTNYVFLNEFKTTTTYGDEDCFFFRQFASGAEMNANLNLCTTDADGFTVDRDATTKLRTAGNVMKTTAAIQGQTAAFAYRSIPCEVYSDGDIIESVGGKVSGANALIGFQIDGNSSGTSCGGGAHVVIKNPHINMTNTTVSPVNGDVYGVLINPAAATELGSGGTVEVYNPDIRVNTADTGAASYGVFNGLGSYSGASVYGGKVRATGGASGTRRDITATGGSTISTLGVDYTSTTSAVVVPGIDQVQLRASGDVVFGSGPMSFNNTTGNSFTLSAPDPATGIILQNTDAVNAEDSQAIKFTNSTAAGGNSMFLNYDSGESFNFAAPAIGNNVFRIRTGPSLVESSLTRFAVFANGASLELGDASGTSDGLIWFRTGSNPLQLTWNDAAQRFTLDTADYIRMGGVQAGVTLNTAGDFSIDTTANQWIYYSGGAVQTLDPVRQVCAVITDLATTDDNFEFWMANQAVHITSVGCRCRGTCTPTLAVFTLEDRAGNAMTGTPTCSTTGDATYAAVSGANALTAGEGLAFDTGDTLSPSGSDEYTLCVTYTIDRQ